MLPHQLQLVVFFKYVRIRRIFNNSELSPFKRDLTFHLNKLQRPLPEEYFVSSLVEIVLDLEKKITL